MSFILDALKKSETERQEQSGAGFSNVPTGTSEPQSFKWLWLLAALLGVNFAVLLGILMRPDKAPDNPVAADVAEQVAAEAPLAEPSFEEKVAKAKEVQAELRVRAPDELAGQVTPEPAAEAAAPARRNSPRVKTLDELRVSGAIQITDLHLDIHVYSEVPEDRFVFINMVKHREHSKLDEGPVVDEITPDGVILAYQGMKFLLPRE
jgi:general secretion pathway protein B